MHKTIHTIACTFVASVVLAACAGSGTMPNAATKEHALPSSPSHPIYLRAMKTQLAAPRAAVGPLYAGADCKPKGEVIWDETLFREVSHQLPRVFRRDAQRAHYRVPPDKPVNTAMLGGDSTHPKYVEVDMQVQDVHARLCMQEEGTSGSAHMKVFWQVYAAGASVPLYETVTQGRFEAPVMEKRPAAEFFAHAFSDALRDLLTERGFREAVVQGAPR